MLQSKFERTLLAIVLGMSVLSFVGCSSGDTDGGDAVRNDAGLGTQFVADGGAGASLAISVTSALTVGGTTSFFITALDPTGAPLPFIRIFCETERGIAILDPSSDGASFGSTGADGRLSGTLGGLTPGSFLIECTAPDGFSLTVRDRLAVTGSVPEGFLGFPGAAGGNLGGGVVIDETPGADTSGVRITSILFRDDGTTTGGSAIDIVRDLDCDGDGTPLEDSSDIEPFFFTDSQVGLQNDSFERISVIAIDYEVLDAAFQGSGSNTATGGSGIAFELAARSTGTIVEPFADIISGDKQLIGSGQSFVIGTFSVRVDLTVVSETGTTFVVSGLVPVNFNNINRCSS